MRTPEQQKAIDDFRELFPGYAEDKTDEEIEELLMNLVKILIKGVIKHIGDLD